MDRKEIKLDGLYKLFGAIIFIWVLSSLVLRWKYPDSGIRGTFRDSFGAINSLFSGLALGGIIYTIFLQKKELELQRQELRETRKEFSQQNRTLNLQRFESTFFNILKSHHDLIAILSTRTWAGDSVDGIYIFPHLNVAINAELNKIEMTNETDFEMMRRSYYETLKKRSESVEPYIGSINTLLYFVESSKLSRSEQSLYYSVIFSRLTVDEKIFLKSYETFSIKEDIQTRVSRLLQSQVS